MRTRPSAVGRESSALDGWRQDFSTDFPQKGEAFAFVTRNQDQKCRKKTNEATLRKSLTFSYLTSWRAAVVFDMLLNLAFSLRKNGGRGGSDEGICLFFF